MKTKSQLAKEYGEIVADDLYCTGRTDAQKVVDMVQAENAFKAGFDACAEKIKNLEPEIVKLVNKHFWELLA